jgi:hypothetical protein
MQKTITAELLESLKTIEDIYCSTNDSNSQFGKLIIYLMKNKIRELSEKEKLNIINSFFEGMLCSNFDPNMGRAQQYFNSEYESN